MFDAFTMLYKTPYDFPQAKYSSTSHVHHVANKLSEIVGILRNSIIRTKIVVRMDAGEYTDAQSMCLLGEFIVKLIPNFQNDRRFLAKCPM